MQRGNRLSGAGQFIGTEFDVLDVENFLLINIEQDEAIKESCR